MLAPPVYTDFSSLESLRQEAKLDPQQGLREAAEQFSAVFLQMTIKAMRDASFGGGILDSSQSEFFRDLYDQQLALEISQGDGLRLADVMIEQLSAAQDLAGSADKF
ncbi:MAG: rod-binding protein [Pseudomonadota bacterium]